MNSGGSNQGKGNSTVISFTFSNLANALNVPAKHSMSIEIFNFFFFSSRGCNVRLLVLY